MYVLGKDTEGENRWLVWLYVVGVHPAHDIELSGSVEAEILK